MSITRRHFLRFTAACFLGAPLLGTSYAFGIEPAWIEITETDVALPGLSAAFDGFCIAHISDLHYGGYLPLARLKRVVWLVNALHADLIVLTGDFVSEPRTATYLVDRAMGRESEDFRHSPNAEAVFGVCIPHLAEMTARLGALAVLGNHDHWVDATVARRYLTQYNIKLMENHHQVLEQEGAQLVIAGVGDLWEGEQDLDRAFAAAPPADNAPRLLLCHNPDFAAASGVAQHGISLMLCGHTHGGQISIPGLGTPIVPIQHREFTRGLVRTSWGHVYISRGIGTISPPARVFTRPEIAVIRLRAQA